MKESESKNADQELKIMPNPKKSNNAPKGAYTDTGSSSNGTKATKKVQKKADSITRPAARQTTQTNDGKSVTRRGSGEGAEHPEYGRAGLPVTRRGPADDTGSWGATHSYDFYDEDHQDRVEGTEGKFYSLLASGGHGGRVGDSTTRQSTPRQSASDPFLRGFNDENPGVVGHYRNRRRHG